MENCPDRKSLTPFGRGVEQGKDNWINLSTQHLGILDGDTEITERRLTDHWPGGLEHYRFQQTEYKTTAMVEVDLIEENLEYFDYTYPKVLEKLKALAEGQHLATSFNR